MLDLFIVLAFVGYSIAAGFAARRKASRDLHEYFLAGRGLKGWQAGTSMAATQFAADTPLLVAGLVATGGVFLLWRLWIYALAFLLMAFVFAALWQRAGVLTDAELAEIRYSGRGTLLLRTFKAIYYGTIFNCVVLAWVLLAAVGITELFLPWHRWLPAALYDPLADFVLRFGLGPKLSSSAPAYPQHLAAANNMISIALILLFTALYAMTGGLRGVVATDIVQFAVALAGTLLFAWFIAQAAGGLRALVPSLVHLYGEERAARILSFAPGFAGEGTGGPDWPALLLPFLAVIGLQWLFQVNSDGTGYLAQRTMACRDEREARFAGIVFAWLQILLRSLPWLVIAVGLLVLYPFDESAKAEAGFAARRELMFVRGIHELMPSGALGLMLTGMLAALASTLDTHLNWGAGYWSNDLYQRLVCRAWLKREPGNRELVLVARLSNVLVIALALVVMVNLGSIQQAWQIALLFGAGVGSVLVLRWLWERINLWSELAAMAVSLLVAPLLLHLGGRARAEGWFAGNELAIEALNLGIMAAASTAAAVAAALLGPPTDPETLESFYRRVRPHGWWRATAARVGDDPSRPLRALARDGLAALLTASSLFLCLYGAGRLLLPHPAVPWPVAAAALVLGVALVPLWWRRASRAEPTDAQARPVSARAP